MRKNDDGMDRILSIEIGLVIIALTLAGTIGINSCPLKNK